MLFPPDISVAQTRAVTVLWKEMNKSNALDIDPGTGLEHSVGLDGGEGGNGILRIDPWFWR